MTSGEDFALEAAGRIRDLVIQGMRAQGPLTLVAYDKAGERLYPVIAGDVAPGTDAEGNPTVETRPDADHWPPEWTPAAAKVVLEAANGDNLGEIAQ